MIKKLLIAALAAVALIAGGCSSQADTASRNLSTAADQFEVQRRVIFYNGITDSYMLTLEGRCSLGNYDKAGQLTVTCKVAEDEYVKHFLGLSDNVTYFVEQLEPIDVSVYRNRIIFRPTTIIPAFELDVKADGE
jgi:hypothetical protein